MWSTILTGWDFFSPWETSLGHVPHARSSRSNQCCITKKQVQRQLCDNTMTAALLDSQLLSENLPSLKPVLNWTNVCSPEHTSDTLMNYDSFLN